MLRSIPMISAVFQAVSVENLGEGQGILSFFKESGLSGKIVLGILLFFSFVSWIIIFAKFVRLRQLGTDPLVPWWIAELAVHGTSK